jgi:hypothetical protein
MGAWPGEKTFTNVRIVGGHADNNYFQKSDFSESFFHMMILISKQKLFLTLFIELLQMDLTFSVG